jgi:hypothetical protein
MSSTTPLYQNLDTTFVNLWSLLRKLTQQGFVGRVHVELQDYSADILLDGSSTPLVREVDRAANTETIEEGALHRVVLRARETPGIINVFEGIGEATLAQPSALTSESPASRHLHRFCSGHISRSSRSRQRTNPHQTWRRSNRRLRRTLMRKFIASVVIRIGPQFLVLPAN